MKNHLKFFICLVLSFLPMVAFAQQTKESVISAYIQTSKSQLSAGLQQIFAPGAQLEPETPYEGWLTEPSPEKMHGMGIPRAVKGSPMESAHPFKLENFSFVIAEYKGNISELYIKKKGGRYKFLFHFDPCNKIYLLKPGEKAPTFLVIRVSNCDLPANWQETVYQMSKAGRLEEVGHLGGQNAVVKLVDLDKNGVMELLNSSKTNHYPEELDKQLKASPGYQEPIGPVLSDNVVYKWNGTEWAKTAEFFDQVGQ